MLNEDIYICTQVCPYIYIHIHTYLCMHATSLSYFLCTKFHSKDFSCPKPVRKKVLGPRSHVMGSTLEPYLYHSHCLCLLFIPFLFQQNKKVQFQTLMKNNDNCLCPQEKSTYSKTSNKLNKLISHR